MKAKWQQLGASPVGEESEVPDAHETFGKHVQQEAAQEFIARKSQQFLFVVVSGIAPTKSDLSFGERDQAMIRDGYAMGVAAQILEHILRAAEGWFRVHHPVLSEQWPQPSGEGLGLGETGQVSMEVELAFLKGLPESSNKLAAENTTEHVDGKKEPIA